MKKSVALFSVMVCVFMTLVSSSQDDKKCIIQGKTFGVQSKSLFLLKAGEDLRFGGIEVPIKDSSFQIEININQPEAYYLMYSEFREYGGGTVMVFFAEPGEINLTLNSEREIKKNLVSGGKLNDEFKKYKTEKDLKFNPMFKPFMDSMNLLYSTGKYFSDTMNVLIKEIQTATETERPILNDKMNDLRKTGKDLSNQAKFINENLNKVSLEMSKYQEDYIKNNSSIVSYFLLYEDFAVNRDKIDLTLASNNYEKLSDLYPNHPYTMLVGTFIESIKSLKVGGEFIDFSAPDINGKVVKLSEAVKGKIALIDLWSSWCSPCIVYSRTMIPVYEKYKDSGFIIVGVTADKSKERLEELIKKESYPWLNLIELDGQNNIWELYGISNSGGKAFLVDTEGKIIAVQPTADEVQSKLQELLK